MSIQPQGDNIRKAVAWISEEIQNATGINKQRLVDQAAIEFNLSPLEVEFLSKFVREEPS
ncbi:MAG: hypothetical protein PVJ53_13645 [Desulfobacterales bacterium]|jgi:hypothetical protein